MVSEPTRLGPEVSLSAGVPGAVHETTGYSPSQMLFGRIFVFPFVTCCFERSPSDTFASPEEYVQNLQARFEMYTIWLKNGST
ncbi:hypothetical protein TNCV_4356051 [Trichonephila clavipes]|nr:hypothetical protein TNCV_4356051 [Trichonephila clavipes]